MRTGRPAIKVGVLEGSDLTREGIVALLNGSSDLTCVGSWSNAADALRAVEARPPDVLMVDAKLPDQSAFEVLRKLPIVSPTTRVLVTVDCREEECVVLNPPSHSNHDKPLHLVSQDLPGPDDCLQLALKIGAHGVLRKNCSFRSIAQAIQAVHGGQYWLELPTATRLAQQYLVSIRPTNPRQKNSDGHLTLRERQVITLIAQGRSNKEIAHELQLGYSTVKNYVSSILQKLNLDDRTQVALYALEKNAAA